MTERTDDRSTLRRQLGRTVLASGVVEGASRVFAVALAIGIARALDPREVGLLGLASIIVSIMSVVASSADVAGVTSQERGDDARYAVIAAIVRAGLTTILVASSLIALPALGHLLAAGEAGETELNAFVRLLLWQLAFELVATFPRVVLQRRLDLAWLPIATLAQVIIHVGLSLWFLWRGYGAEGVIVASLAGAALSAAVPWIWLIRGGRWAFAATVATPVVWGHVLRTTMRVMAARTIGYLNGRVDNVLVAGALGPTAMSFYSMAWGASRQPIGALSQALESVLMPTFSHTQGAVPRTREAIRSALRHYYVVLGVLCSGLFVAAPSIVSVMLGDKWLPLVPCLRVMTCTMLLAPTLTVSHSLLMGTGRAQLIALGATSQLAVLLILIVPLSKGWGIVGAAFGDLVAMSAVAVVLSLAVRRAIPEVELGVRRAATLPVLAAVVAGGGGWIAGSSLADGIVRLGSELTVITLLYGAILWSFGARDTVGTILTLLKPDARRPGSLIGVVESRLR